MQKIKKNKGKYKISCEMFVILNYCCPIKLES